MNLTNLTNCGDNTMTANQALRGGLGMFAGRIFSYYDFDKTIRDTLENDAVIKQIKKTTPYFSGSAFSVDNIVSNSLYHQFLTNYVHTKAMYQRLSTIRFHYLVDCALRTMVNDSLAQDPFTGQIFNVTVNEHHPYSKKATRIIQDFMEEFQIDRAVEEMAPNAIFYGEYAATLQTDGESDTKEGRVGGKGITQIILANPPGTIYGVWEAMYPKYYLRLKKGVDVALQGQLERLPAKSVWHMPIFPREINLSMGYASWLYDDSNRISQYLKVGQPLFYSVYNKILELEAFEQGQVQKCVGDTRRRGLVGVAMPAGLSNPQDVETVKHYERILNETHGVDNINDVQGLDAIGHMMSTLSKIRVIPQLPDRGKMEVIDLKVASDNIASEITDRRKIILESLGIPYEYIMNQSSSRGASVQNIRQYVHYVRRIKMIQHGIAWSLQRLLQTQLMYRGIQVKPMDVEVKFYRAINVSEMDSLEGLNANIQYLKEVHEFTQALMTNPMTAKYLNVSEKMRHLDKVFSQVEGVGKLIKVPEDEDIMADSFLNDQQNQNGEQFQPPQEQGNIAQDSYPFQPQNHNEPLPGNVSIRNDVLPPNVRLIGGAAPNNVRVS